MVSLSFDTSNYICCNNNCYNLLRYDDVLSNRLILKRSYPSQAMQKQFIVDHIINHRSKENCVFYPIGDSYVCRTAWLRCFGLSQSLFIKALRFWKKGSYVVLNDLCNFLKLNVIKTGNTSVLQDNIQLGLRAQSAETIGWMNTFFKKACEKSPNTCHWYLPSYLTKLEIFNLYKQTLRETYICQSQFYRLWLEYYPNVTIPAVIKL